MSADIASRYIKKVNTKINQVDETDAFSQSFMDSIKAGKNTLYQKHLSETRIFDGTWVDTIEKYVASIDNIVRDPRSFIKSTNEIVPVERAKKTDSESIRHLASHSQYVREFDSNVGNIVPSKVMTVFREEDLAIYENRFVKTLIDKLTVFVERRYEVIAKLIGTDYLNKMNSKSNFQYEDIDIEYEINMTIKREIRDNILEKKNYVLLDRVEELRKNIMAFRRSEFMKALAGVKPVFPPIQKTNIIMKQPDYKKCYELWMFLDSYDRLDYTIEMYDNEISFSDEYINELRRLVMLGFATVVSNDNSELGRITAKAKLFKKEKKTRILDSLRQELAMKENTTVKVEENTFNEYYLQEAKKIYSEQVQEKVDNGETFHMAVQDAYKESSKISEAIFDQLLEMPENIKDDHVASLRHRLRTQKALEQIIEFKEKDLKRMKKQQLAQSKKLEEEKKRYELEQARQKLIQKYSEQGLTDEQIKDKLLTPEERKKKREKDRIRALKEKERLALKAKQNKEKERLAEKERKEKERLALKAKAEKERLALKAKVEKERERQKALKEKVRQALKLKAEKEKERLALIAKKKKEKEKAKKEKEKLALKAKQTGDKEQQAPKKLKLKKVVPEKKNEEILEFDSENAYMSDLEKELINKKEAGVINDSEMDQLDQLKNERNKVLNANYNRRIEALKKRRKENIGNNEFGEKGSIKIINNEE